MKFNEFNNLKYTAFGNYEKYGTLKSRGNG